MTSGDFAIQYSDGGRVGIECKLFEAYGRLQHHTLSRAYLDLPGAWADIPAWRALAETLSGGGAGNAPSRRLGAAQLVTHVLGLRFGASSAKVWLLYVYHDAIGPEAAEHRTEVDRFRAQIAGDPIAFVPMSVQELILRAVRQLRPAHTSYVDYLAERYL